MVLKQLIMATAVVTTCAAVAETKAYVDLNYSQSGSYDDLVKEKDYWLTDSRLWGGNAAGDANTDYRVSDKLTIECQYYKSGTGATFGGKSLTFGSIGDIKSGNFSSRMYTGSYLEFGNEGIYLEKGAFQQVSSGHRGEIRGKVTVNSAQGAEFEIRGTHARASDLLPSSWLISADVVCAAGNGLLLKYSPNANMKLAEAIGKHSPVSFSGDLSAFAGRLTVQSNILFTVGTTTLPGEVKLASGGYFGAYTSTDCFKIGTLTLAKDSRLMVAQDATGASSARVEVTDKFDFPASVHPLKIVLESTMPFTNTTATTVLKIAKDAYASDLTAGDFELVSAASFNSVCGTAITVSKDVDGNQLVQLATTYPIYNMTVSDSYNLDAAYDTQSGYTNGWQWSEADDKPPHAGAIYQVYQKCLRTPFTKTGTSVFPGRVLVLDNADLYLRASSNVIDNLYVTDNSSNVRNCYDFSSALSGEITINGTLRIMSYGAHPDKTYGSYRGIRLYSKVKGKGVLKATTNQSSSNVPGETVLLGDTSELYGQIVVTISDNKDKGYPNYEKGYAVLSFDDAAKLGGPLDAFRADGILVEQKCVLRPRATTTLAEMTRGITFNDGRLHTREADTVFTVKPPVHFEGLMRKEGPGVLVLEGSGTASETGTVQVLGGYVQARRKDAFAGVPITFAAGTGLRVDARPDDADVATYGLYAAASGAITAEGESLQLAFADDAPASTYAARRTVAVMTVHADDADALQAKLAKGIVKPVRGVRVKLSSTEVDAGTKTILATVSPAGMAIILK